MRLYELDRGNSKLGGNRKEIRLVRLEEAKKRRKQCRIRCPLSQLSDPNSGHIEESLRPSCVTKRCGKRGKRKDNRILMVFAQQGLSDGPRRSKGRIWPRS